MRTLKITFLSALVITFFFSSCKKSNDEGGDATPTMTQEKIDEGSKVQDEKPPRSEKKEGEFTFEGETVTSPINLQNDADSDAKIDILTAGTGASSAKLAANGSMYGWYANSIGGSEVKNEYIYFFLKDGTYMYYNQKTSTWDWGYYYINRSLTMLITDYDSDFQKWWKVDELTPTKCVWTHKTEGEVILKGFTLNGAEKTPMTEVKFKNKVLGKNWYITEFDAGNVIDIDSNRYYKFSQDNFMYGFKYDEFENRYLSDDTLSYSILSNGTFNLKTGDDEELNMDVLYITQNQFALFDTENGDGDTGLFNYIFQTQARMQATYDEYSQLLVEE